jgi:hypothetical protein
LRRIIALHALIYAGLYDSALRNWKGDNGMASVASASCLGGTMAVNGFLLLMLYGEFVGSVEGLPLWIPVLIAGILLAANYFAFLYADRHLEVLKRFHALSISEQRRTKKWAWTYVATSLALPLFFAVVLAVRSGQLRF